MLPVSAERGAGNMGIATETFLAVSRAYLLGIDLRDPRSDLLTLAPGLPPRPAGASRRGESALRRARGRRRTALDRGRR
jgi:hypothetical protein